MAPESESAAEKAAVTLEVGPTKDVIEAFMEKLVDPRLPWASSVDGPPSQDDQKSVATQMHAVVLLYNYYHRKQKPELEFLDFASFCKMALLLRPSLSSFMKSTNGTESMESQQLSVTEKAIKDACDISMSLDASKDVPTYDGFSISKVAVLLIDSERENCLLQFGAVTEGVWSLIEKELTECDIDNVAKKRKWNNQKESSDDPRFLQLGIDALKDITGFDSSKLMLLESRVTYSLSKEKSAARFYIVQCPRFDTNQIAPLKFLVDSLQGPLAENFCGSWVTTTLVEYFHVLPYLVFIESWLPRKDLCLPISIDLGDHIDKDSFETKVGSREKIANEDREEDNLRKDKLPSRVEVANSVRDIFRRTAKVGNVKDRLKTSGDNLNSVKKDTLENVDNFSGKRGLGSLSSRSTGLPKNKSKDNSSMEKFLYKPDSVDSAKKEGSRTYTETSNDENYEREDTQKKSNSNSNSKFSVYHSQRKNLKVDVVSPLKLNDTPENRDMTVLCNQSDIGVTGKAVVPFEAKNDIQVKNVPDSEDLQNALALLYRKRQELSSQICNMEDELALYEDNVERIRDGGEVGLARECIKSILSGNGHLIMWKNETHQSKKQTRLSDIFLPGRSSCQDLEYICLKNNWRLPKYFVEPSDGKFVANVAVGSNEFKLSSKSGLESSPCEARESAAAEMIAKIRKSFESNGDES